MDPEGQILKYLTGDLRSWVEPGDLAYLVAQYDAAIHSFDSQIGQLFAELAARGFLARTMIVLTADHGEALLERASGRTAISPDSEEEHVPMMVIPPRGHGDEPARIGGIVTTTDLCSYTLLRHFGALPEKPRPALGGGWAFSPGTVSAASPTPGPRCGHPQRSALQLLPLQRLRPIAGAHRPSKTASTSSTAETIPQRSATCSPGCPAWN